MASPRRPIDYDNDSRGWFVISAAFVTYVIIMGNVKSLGVFLLDMENDFDSNMWLIGRIAVMNSMLRYFLGPLVAVLVRLLGSRLVIISGGCMTTLGFILASQSSNVVQLAIFLAGLSGFGAACSGFATFALLASYFKVRYVLAVGISTMGYPIGMIVFGPVSQLLLDTYGWRGATLLMGGTSFHLVALGAFVTRNLSPTDKSQYQDVSVKDEEGSGKEDEEERIDSGEDSHIRNDNGELNQENNTQTTVSRCQRFSKAMDFAVLTNVRFLLLTAARCCCEFCFTGWLVFMVSYGQFQGLSQVQASFLPTAFGVGNILGKALTPLLQQSRMKPTLLFWACLGSALICVFFITSYFVEPFATQMVTTGLIGMGFGMVFQANDVLTRFISTDDRLVNFLGWQVLFAGFSGISGGFLAGWLYDWTGSFKSTLFMFGGTVFLSIPLHISDDIYYKKIQTTSL